MALSAEGVSSPTLIMESLSEQLYSILVSG